jgi:hypothetical protein
MNAGTQSMQTIRIAVARRERSVARLAWQHLDWVRAIVRRLARGAVRWNVPASLVHRRRNRGTDRSRDTAPRTLRVVERRVEWSRFVERRVVLERVPVAARPSLVPPSRVSSGTSTERGGPSPAGSKRPADRLAAPLTLASARSATASELVVPTRMRVVPSADGSAPTGSRPAARVLAGSRSALPAVSEPGELPARIVHGLRRREERPGLLGREAYATATVRTDGPPPVVLEPSPARRAERHPAIPDPPPVEPARPGPSVDVSHLADEVMRQLDCRLVAARERLGIT